VKHGFTYGSRRLARIVEAMCGRFVSATPPDELAAYFDAAAPPESLPQSFNVAPTNDIWAVVETPAGRSLEAVHWGLVPSWAKDMKLGQKMINARAETLLEKNVFKAALKRRRCIIPVDGFYEWKVIPGQKAKQPYFIHRADGEPLAFAGLWETWRDPNAGPDAPVLHSATIVTVAANGDMAPIHDRMPAVLTPATWAEWLDRGNDDVASLTGLLVPAPDGLLTMHRVSTDVNNVRNRGEHLIDEYHPDEGQATLL